MNPESGQNITDLPTIDPVEELVAEYIGLKLEQVRITPRAFIESVHESLREEVLERLERYESVRDLIPHALEVFKPPPEILGDFRILGEIGRGGAGIVYRAEQISLRRTVALKILPPAAGLSARSVERFLDGAVAAARLAHPNIIPVHTAGEVKGILFLAMEYVPGPALSAVLAALGEIPLGQRCGDDIAEILRPYAEQCGHPGEFEGRYDPRGRSYQEAILRIGEALSDALEACHRLGVLHRDIKPGNIIIAPDGCPRLMDFGLSRLDDSERGLTVTGEMLGTPSYLAPERVDHGLKAASECGDVYSLGATLYECFAGRPPFVEESLSKLLCHISGEAPPALGEVAQGVSTQLEAVIMTAIAKDPTLRHPSPALLREDLRALLFGQRPPFACARSKRFVRVRSRLARAVRGRSCRPRNWVLAAGMAAVLMALMIWSPWLATSAGGGPSGSGTRAAPAPVFTWRALVRALDCERLGQLSRAEKAFATIARRFPDNRWARFELGAFYLRCDTRWKARPIFRRLLDESGGGATEAAWMDLCRGRVVTRERFDALVRDEQPGADPLELHMLADLAHLLGWNDLALALYDQVLAGEDHLWVRCERGWAALDAGRREEALRDLLRSHDRMLWRTLGEGGASGKPK